MPTNFHFKCTYKEFKRSTFPIILLLYVHVSIACGQHIQLMFICNERMQKKFITKTKLSSHTCQKVMRKTQSHTVFPANTPRNRTATKIEENRTNKKVSNNIRCMCCIRCFALVFRARRSSSSSSWHCCRRRRIVAL